MLTLYQVKPAFQNRLRPVVTQLAQWGVTPNQVTLSAIALSGLTGLAIALFPTASLPLLFMPVALLGRMSLNAIDGMLAREYRLTSAFGAVLNEFGDVIADIVLYLPFCLIPGVSSKVIVGVVLLAILTEFAGVLGQAIAAKRFYNGPMGKSDRALVFGIIAFLLGLGIAPGNWLTGGLMLVWGLELWTIANRIHASLREVQLCR